MRKLSVETSPGTRLIEIYEENGNEKKLIAAANTILEAERLKERFPSVADEIEQILLES